MPAAVKNNAFLLGEATVMLAPFGSVSPFELTPAAHSIGMVRNVNLSVEADTVDLRKGVQQLLVDSKRANVRPTLTAEVFEFSAQNMFYGLSLNRTPVAPKRGKLKTAITGAVATFIVNTDPLPGQPSTGITAVGDIPNGATILIQDLGSGTDLVLPVKVTATTTVSTTDYTVTAAVPAGMTFSAGARVWVVNEIPIGSTAEQDTFSMKIASTLSNNDKPVVLVVPKVKIRRGFQLAFDEGSYGNMPFEFDPFFLSSDEISGRLSEIGTDKLMMGYSV